MTPPAHCKQTRSGVAFDVLAPTLDMIRIEDIAHHLACINRYTGAAPEPFSVAQHSVLVSLVAERCSSGDPIAREAALFGLLHDAAEAYLNDIARPVKRLPQFAFYRQLEDDLQAVIYARFGLPVEVPSVVKFADDVLAASEAAKFFPPETRPFPWDLPTAVVAEDLDLDPWPWHEAKRRFLARFEALAGSLGVAA